jgi:chromosome segregation ATPase
MISNFSNFKVNEQDVSDSYVQGLIDQISRLEDLNQNLNDKIDQLEDDIRDMEKTNDDQSEKIYGLEESFEKLEKQYSKLEDEKESLEKTEGKLIEEKQDLEAQLKIFHESYTTFDKGTDEEKLKVVEAFLDMLDIMEDRPLEFGALLRKEMKERPRFERVINATLNQEWVESYTGGGSGLLNRLGIQD